MKLTCIARTATNEMLKAQAIAINTQWDMNDVDRQFSPTDTPNIAYNLVATHFLRGSTIVHIVNAYQWYNGQIFRLLAAADKNAFLDIAEGVNLSKNEIKRIALGEDPIVVAAERLSMRDHTVRSHLHKTLGLWEEAEMSTMVDIRNCISHHLGCDFNGAIERWLSGNASPFGLNKAVYLEDGVIRLGEMAPATACSIGLAQITMFDQMVSARFNLERIDDRPFSLSRQKKANQTLMPTPMAFTPAAVQEPRQP